MTQEKVSRSILTPAYEQTHMAVSMLADALLKPYKPADLGFALVVEGTALLRTHVGPAITAAKLRELADRLSKEIS